MTVGTPRTPCSAAISGASSTFTLTTRTGLALAQIANALGEEQAEIEGFEMLAPVSVSKSGVIDIAVAMLRKHLGLESMIPAGLKINDPGQP